MLALAAATRRVGYVFLVGDRLKDWRVSEKAAKSPEDAAEAAQTWINELKPDVVVTEKAEEPPQRSRRCRPFMAMGIRQPVSGSRYDPTGCG